MTATAAPPAFARVGVVGGGLMGAGIAEVCARAGCDVVIVEAGRSRPTAPCDE